MKVICCNKFIHEYNYILECNVTLPIQLPAISPSIPVTCNLMDTCTGVTCCLDIAELSLSVNFYIMLDACDYEFSVGIENLPYKKTLLSYEFGKEETLNLNNIVRLT